MASLKSVYVRIRIYVRGVTITRLLSALLALALAQFAAPLAAQSRAVFFPLIRPLEIVEGNTQISDTVRLTVSSPQPSAIRISGGVDAELFRLGEFLASGTGENLPRERSLVFNDPPDFELPLDGLSTSPPDKRGNNLYIVEITADFPTSSSVSQIVRVQVSDVSEPPSFIGPREVEILERRTSVLRLSVIDDKGTPLIADREVTFSIGSEDGDATTAYDADNALFRISSDNLLSFRRPLLASMPRDAPFSGTNISVYRVRVTASRAGSGAAFIINRDFEVTVLEVDDPPLIDTSVSPISSVENSTTITTLSASDPDGDRVTFELLPSRHSHLFRLTPLLGTLTWAEAPDFENPPAGRLGVGMNTNPQYLVRFAALSGRPPLRSTAELVVMVTDEPELPASQMVVVSRYLPASAQRVAAETELAAVSGVDARAAPGAMRYMYQLNGGADMAAFALQDGYLILTSPLPIASQPTDANGDGRYEVIVRITGTSGADVAEEAVVTVHLYLSPSIPENSDLVMDVPPGTRITDGADRALFRIRDNILRFLVAPDYENPLDIAGTTPDGDGMDAAGNNRYLVELTTGETARGLVVFVGNSENEIEAGSDVTVVPGEIVILSAETASPGSGFSWRFVSSSVTSRGQMPLLNANTAEMQFIVPADAAGEVLTFEVSAGSAVGAPSDRVTVTVLPAMTLDDELITVAEDVPIGTLMAEPLVATNRPSTGAALWTIEDGDVHSLFSIDQVGQLRLVDEINADQLAPDPTYILRLRLEQRVTTPVDVVTMRAEGSLTIRVLSVNEAPNANAGGDQRVMASSLVQLIGRGSDEETPDDQLRFGWTLSDPNINITGEATRRPTFSAPSTGTEDIVLVATLTVTDDEPFGSARTGTDSSLIIVSASVVPSLTPSSITLAESTPTGTMVHGALVGQNFPPGTSFWSFVSGNDNNTFAINSANGEVRLLNELDFESPMNSFELVVRRTVGDASADAAIAVTLTDADDVPTIRILGPRILAVTAGAQVSLRAELNEQDPEMLGDNPDMMMPNPFAMEITHLWTLGVLIDISGADQLEASFQAPTTPGMFFATITVMQTGRVVTFASQSIRVVTSDSGPLINSRGLSVMENLLVVGQLTPNVDIDGDPVTFALESGRDTGLFSLTVDGVLSFLAAPDFEQPSSREEPPSNLYVLNVQSTSQRGGGTAALSLTQEVSVTVLDDRDEPPQFVGDGEQTYSVSEGSILVATVPANDPESHGITYALLGPDRALFRVTANGQLVFREPPDFENPLDVATDNPVNAAANNEYVVVISATSVGPGASAVQQSDVVSLIIIVTDITDEAFVAAEYPAGQDAFLVRDTSDGYVGAGTSIGQPLSPPRGFSVREINWEVEFVGMFDIDDANAEEPRFIDRSNEALFVFAPAAQASMPAIRQLVTGDRLSSDSERFRIRVSASNFYGDTATHEVDVIINPDSTPATLAVDRVSLMVGAEIEALLTDEGIGATAAAATAAAAWQWQYLDETDGRWRDILGATDNSYTPGLFFQLLKLRARATYFEGGIRRQIATGEQVFRPLVERGVAIERMLGVLAREIGFGAVNVISSRFTGRGREYAVFGSVGSSGPDGVWTMAGANMLRDVGERRLGGDWLRQNLLGSKFAVQIRRAEEVGTEDIPYQLPLTVWGEGGYQVFQGGINDELSRFSGNLTTAYLGVDWQFSIQGMAGLAYSHSRGRTDFTSVSDGEGSLITRLNIIYPYIHYVFEDVMLLWGAAGYGEGNGDYQLVVRGEETRTKLEYLMFAGGFRHSPLLGNRGGFAWKGDITHARLEGKESGMVFTGAKGSANRARLAAEGNFNFDIGTAGIISTSIDLGARYDDGTTDTGFGIDVNFDTTIRDIITGFTLSGRGNVLLDHQAKGMRSYGGAISITFEPADGFFAYGLAPFVEVAVGEQRVGTDITAGVNLSKHTNWTLQFLTKRGAEPYPTNTGAMHARPLLLPTQTPTATLFMIQFNLKL